MRSRVAVRKVSDQVGRRATLLALAVALGSGLAGCSSPKKKPGGGGYAGVGGTPPTSASPTPGSASESSGAAASADDPASLYRAGRYASAYEAARVRAGRESGPERERMQLVAGLSAAAMNRNAEAMTYLRPLASSADQEIAGRASAGVGLIEAEAGRHASAVPHLRSAASKLKGDESAKAWFYLGESMSALGQSAEANSAYRQASSVATGARLKRLADDRLSLTAFTIQIGSYRDPGKANQAAAAAAGRARSAGLTAPRVVAKSLPDGRSVYAVQIGVYSELSRAQADRARLGGDAVVTRTAR